MPRKKTAPKKSQRNDFNTVTTVSKLLAFFMFVTFPFIGFYLGMNFQKELDRPFIDEVTSRQFEEEQRRSCTMEAKQCPDGSYVARTGPNCTFEKCPDEK